MWAASPWVKVGKVWGWGRNGSECPESRGSAIGPMVPHNRTQNVYARLSKACWPCKVIEWIRLEVEKHKQLRNIMR